MIAASARSVPSDMPAAAKASARLPCGCCRRNSKVSLRSIVCIRTSRNSGRIAARYCSTICLRSTPRCCRRWNTLAALLPSFASSAAALGVCLRVAWRTMVLAGRPAEEILAQQVYQILADYPDCNDADTLRTEVSGFLNATSDGSGADPPISAAKMG